MAVVRELLVKLGFKVDKKQVSNAENVMSKLKRAAIGLAGAFAVSRVASGLSNLIQETAALGDSIDKVSSKLGIGAQALQELRFAGEQTGVATRTMDMALQRFTRRAAEAAKGTGEAKDALKQMNIQLKDSQGNLRPTEDLFGDVADAMSKMTSDGDRLRLAFKLFDSEGVALVNTLKGGRAALDEMRQAAVLTGGIMTDELIASSVEFTDSMGTMALVMRGVKNIVATELLPRFTAGANSIIEWVKANRALIAQNIGDFFRRSADFVENMIGFVLRAVKSISKFTDGLSPLQKGLIKVGAAILIISKIIKAGPIGRLIALGVLIAAIIDDFETWKKGGVSVIGAIIKKIDELRERFPALDTAIRALSDAFELIKTVASDAFDFIKDVVLLGFSDAFEKHSDKLLATATATSTGIETAWSASLVSMKEGLAAAGKAMEPIWAAMLDSAEKAFVSLGKFFTSGDAKEALKGIDDFAGELVVSINQAVQSFESAVFAVLKRATNAATEGILDAFVSGGVKKALEDLAGVFGVMLDAMTVALGDEVQVWAGIFGDDFGLKVRAIFDTIASAFRMTWESLADILTTAVGVLDGIITAFVTLVIDLFRGRFTEAFRNVFSTIKALAIETFDLLIRQLKTVVKLTAKVGTVAKAIKGVFFGDEDQDDEVTRRTTDVRGAGPPPGSRRQPQAPATIEQTPAVAAPILASFEPLTSEPVAARAPAPFAAPDVQPVMMSRPDAPAPFAAPDVQPVMMSRPDAPAPFAAPGVEVITSEPVAARAPAPFTAPDVQPIMSSRPEPRPLPPALVTGARVLASTEATGVMPSPVAGPVASSTSTVNTINNRNRANVKVSVQATPGMDEAKLADLVGKRVETAIGDTMRGAMDDVGLIPEAG